MMKQVQTLLLVCVLNCWMPVVVVAEDLPGAQPNAESFTINSNQALRAYPGGDQVGDLLVGAQFVRREVRGDWAKIAVEAWIPADQIVAKGTHSAETPPAAVASISLVDFAIEPISKRESGGDKNRVKLTLKLKNATSSQIDSWEGWLMVYHRSGSQLFRAPVSSAKKTIPPGEVVDFSFFWQEKDDQYDYLVNESKSNLRLELQGVRVLSPSS